MGTLLSKLAKPQMTTLLDLGSKDSIYCSVRDIAREGQQHIDCLAVIFSGSQNSGKSYCSDAQNPFLVTEGDDVDRKGNPIPLVSWKEDFEAHFPRLAELEQNKAIPSYLFKRGFLRKAGASGTPIAILVSQSTSSSSSCSSSFSATSSPIPERRFDDLYEDNPSNSYNVHELDNTPEKSSSSQQISAKGEITEHYVLDNIRSGNRGYCSLRIAGSSPLLMEFNLDETCSEVVTFSSLPGTHRWMLFKDIVRGSVVIPAGGYLSITSIDSNQKVTCCVEAITPSDILQRNSPQLYKVNRDYFRIPELVCSSPISIEG